MKSLITAAALAGLLALTGCAAASQDASAPASSAAASPSGMAEAQSSESAAAAPTTQASQPAGSLEGKVHYNGDYAVTTPAESAEIIEISKQWFSNEKKAALKAKMDAAGLSSKIPADIAPTWYARAAASCQAKFDGNPLVVDGVYAEINTLILSTYCPGLP